MSEVALKLEKMLREESDENHLLSMPKILSLFEEEGMTPTRPTLYKAIDLLRSSGLDIVYVNAYRDKGYYLKHVFSPSETLFLTTLIDDNTALSSGEKTALLTKLNSLQSVYERKGPQETDSAQEDALLEKVEILLKAMKDLHFVAFNYFDIDLRQEKKYRRDRRKYLLVPYAVIPHQNRFYCVFYDPQHHGFSNYRLDKMDHIEITPQVQTERVPFDLNSYMRASFDMYHGQAETVTIRFKRNMASLLFDQFSRDSIIIREIRGEDFIASLRTAVTPTFISWLLLYYDRCMVLSPDSLKKRMADIGVSLIETYTREEPNNGRQD